MVKITFFCVVLQIVTSTKNSLPSHRVWKQLCEDGGISVAVLRVSHHSLELTQAAVAWFVSVVIWQVTDKSKHSGSHGIVHGREISWEPSADFPPTFTSPYKHRQDCLPLVSIHFFRCLIVKLRAAIVQVV